MRFVHANKERIIFQITGGELDGAFVQVDDIGMKIYNLPGESKSRKKIVEWIDLMIMNEALAGYNPELGAHELGFILGLCEAVQAIYEDVSYYREGVK